MDFSRGDLQWKRNTTAETSYKTSVGSISVLRHELGVILEYYRMSFTETIPKPGRAERRQPQCDVLSRKFTQKLTGLGRYRSAAKSSITTTTTRPIHLPHRGGASITCTKGTLSGTFILTLVLLLFHNQLARLLGLWRLSNGTLLLFSLQYCTRRKVRFDPSCVCMCSGIQESVRSLVMHQRNYNKYIC